MGLNGLWNGRNLQAEPDKGSEELSHLMIKGIET